MSDVDGLDVYMHGAFSGTLDRLSQAKLRFTYDDAWVGEERPPLSLSLPVRTEPYGHDDCAPFFEGLLPEGDFLKAIARTLHVSATNSFQLLTELGGECAGAISVAPSGGPEPGRDPRAPRWMSEAELGALLADLPQRPLIAAIDEDADGGGFRLSLAGAHNKVGVLSEGERGEWVGLSYGQPPTTSILKAPIRHVNLRGATVRELHFWNRPNEASLEGIDLVEHPPLGDPLEEEVIARLAPWGEGAATEVIESLDEDRLELLTLRHVEGVPLAVIADAADVSVSAISQRLSTIHRRLETALAL